MTFTSVSPALFSSLKGDRKAYTRLQLNNIYSLTSDKVLVVFSLSEQEFIIKNALVVFQVLLFSFPKHECFFKALYPQYLRNFK